MNPLKFLSEVQTILERYGPIIMVHFFVIAWLVLRVLIPDILGEISSVWQESYPQVSKSLEGIGIKVAAWYVIVAALIGYLITFDWVGRLLRAAPILEIIYYTKYDRNLIKQAAMALDSPPNRHDISSKLRNFSDTQVEEYIDSKGNHPQQYYNDKRDKWSRYYAAILTTILLTIIWIWYDAPFSRSSDRVWEFLIILLIGSIVIRRYIKRLFAEGQNQTAWWALRNFARENVKQFERGSRILSHRIFSDLLDRQFDVAYHPSSLIMQLSIRLPEAMRKWVWEHTWRPETFADRTWEAMKSEHLSFSDDAYSPPASLSTKAYEKRFSALLECTGSGLTLLTHRESGTAPVASGAGSSFCFILRKHGYGPATIELSAKEDGTDWKINFRSFKKGYLVHLGKFPIERLVQEDVPNNLPMGIYDVLSGRVMPDNMGGKYRHKTHLMHEKVQLSTSMSVEFGSSYFLCSQLESGTICRVVFQCFAVEDPNKLLIAWYLKVRPPDEDINKKILPFWKLNAWKETLRMRDGTAYGQPTNTEK